MFAEGADEDGCRFFVYGIDDVSFAFWNSLSFVSSTSAMSVYCCWWEAWAISMLNLGETVL